jgi:hypothetical protein
MASPRSKKIGTIVVLSLLAVVAVSSIHKYRVESKKEELRKMIEEQDRRKRDLEYAEAEWRFYAMVAQMDPEGTKRRQDEERVRAAKVRQQREEAPTPKRTPVKAWRATPVMPIYPVWLPASMRASQYQIQLNKYYNDMRDYSRR